MSDPLRTTYALQDWNAMPVPGQHLSRIEGLSEETIRVAPPSTSRFLVGSVAVQMVIVSGPNLLGINEDEQNLIVKNTKDAMSKFCDAESRAHLSFEYVKSVVSINAEPDNACGTNDKCEKIWRDPALQDLGYQTGRAGVLDLVQDLLADQNTDWAFAGLFSKYPAGHPAYARGFYFVIKYGDPDIWPRFGEAIFHETAHIFGAADEYNQIPGTLRCSCDPSGFLSVPNSNCVNCTNDQKRCAMADFATFDLCDFSRRQLGWDPVIFDINTQWTIDKGDSFIPVDFFGGGHSLFAVHRSKNLVGTIFAEGRHLTSLRPADTSISGWDFFATERFHPASFTDAGKQQVLVYNPGRTTAEGQVGILSEQSDNPQVYLQSVGKVGSWVNNPGDQHYPTDLDGDGIDEILVISENGKYAGIWQPDDCLNSYCLKCVKIQQDKIGAWVMNKGDEHIPLDWDGDGATEIVVISPSSGTGKGYFGVWKKQSDTYRLTAVAVHEGNVGAWVVNPTDKHIPADLDGDGADELLVINAISSANVYVGVWKKPADSYSFSCQLIQHGKIGSWVTNPGDRYVVADLDGDGRDEILVASRSAGTDQGFVGVWKLNLASNQLECIHIQESHIGAWRFNPEDRHIPVDFDGSGKSSILVVSDFYNTRTGYVGVWDFNGSRFECTSIVKGGFPIP